MTDTLDFVPGDPTWTGMRNKGLKDLYYFASVICRYGDRVPITEPAHKILCKIVERKTGLEALDKAWVRKFEMPRGTGKTTTITQAYLLQRICRNPNVSICLVNENGETAKKILSEIKHQIINNELLRVLYPEIVPEDTQDTTWAATAITTKRTESRKEPTVFVIGVGGTITGLHPDIIFVDDMLSREAMESSRAGSVADVMGQINRWIHQQVPLLSGSPERELTFIGCLAEGSRVLMASGQWKEIQDITVGESVYSWDPEAEEFAPQRVTGVWPQGSADVVQVKTDRHELICTPNHPFLKSRHGRDGLPKWVQAQHLRIGQQHAGVETLKNLPENPYSHSDIEGYGEVCEDFLWMLGFLWGDGWVTRSARSKHRRSEGYAVCCAIGEHGDLNQRIRESMTRFLGNKVYETKGRYYRTDNAEAFRMLDNLGLKPGVGAKKKRLPDWIWGLHPHEKRAFVMGLIDSDGMYYKRSPITGGKQGYRFFTSSKDLAHGVRELALTCNLRPTAVWFRSRLMQAPHSHTPIVTEEYHVDLREERYDTALRRWKVKSVTPLKTQVPVWDLSVENTENFVAEGFVVHNTRWWHGDSYEHLEESFGYGQDAQHYMLKARLADGSTQRLPAYRVGDLVVFRRAAIEDGQPAFISLGEDKYGLEALAKLRLQDPELFAANYLNQPSDELTATFKESWLRYYDWLDGESGDQLNFIDIAGKRRTTSLASLDVLAFVDPGGFGKNRGGDRARAAIAVTGSTTDGAHLVLDVYSERGTYVQCQKEFIGFVRRYGVRKAYVERAGQQIVFIDQLRDLCRKEGLSVIIEEVTTGVKSKDDRILGLEEPFQRATIYVGRGPKFHEFRTQYQQFPKAARKDLLDALSMAPGRWRRVGGVNRQASQRQAAELASYYSKRGINPAA